jgi:Dicarboxylate transport
MQFKPTRRALLIGGFAILLVVALATAGAFVLPVYIQSRIIPRLVAGFGLVPAEVHVRRIGLWGADLGPIRLDNQHQTVLALAAVQIDYTPWSLLTGRIEGITLGGMEVQLTAGPGGIIISGLKLPQRDETPSQTGKPLDLASLLPIRLDHFNIIQSRAVIDWKGRSYSIPLMLRLKTADLNRGVLQGQVRLSILGNPVTLEAALDQHANSATVNLTCGQFRLESLCHTGLLPEGSTASGIVDLNGAATLKLNPLAVSGLRISGHLNSTRLAVAQAALRNTVGAGGESQPMAFSITTGDSDRLLLGCGPFRIDGPLRVTASEFKGVFTPGQPDWSLDGRLETLVPQQKMAGGLAWKKALPMTWQVRLDRGAAKAVDFKISSTGNPPLDLGLDPLELTAATLAVHCRGQLSAQGVRADAALTTGRLQLLIPPAGLKSTQGRTSAGSRRLASQGLSLDLPLQWPPVGKIRSGKLVLPSLQWQDRQLGGIQGTVRQEARALKLHLEHRSKLLTGLRVFMDVGADAEGIRADVRVPAYQPKQGMDLGRFLPAAAGITVGGRLQARGKVAVTRTGLHSRADLALDHGFVTQDAQKLKLDGIAMTLQMDDIAGFKSAPRQRLRVADLQVGNLRAQHLDVDFQVENRQTLLLEKVGLQWCRGRINTGAVRIVAGKEDYDVTLFCDRLDLAMVLDQLGAAEASGEGTVNGRIPLRWINGRISFDNGFLYSTPGQTGKIQLKETRTLLAGIPPGSPQHTQLDIATEVLKDYTYQWAKLNVQSEKDTLLLKLQLDGKPNRLLPFAYNQKLGQFIRVEGEGQADFTGIGIDLNFNIPLNKIIHYKDLLRN